MDNVRRAKIEVLIPILEAVEGSVRELFSQEEDAVDGMPANLRETERAQMSEDTRDALDSAWDHIAEATEELKKALCIDHPEPEIQSAPTIDRRGL